MSKIMMKIINLKTQNRRLSAINKSIKEQLEGRHGFHPTKRCPTEHEAVFLHYKNLCQISKNGLRIKKLRDVK